MRQKIYEKKNNYVGDNERKESEKNDEKESNNKNI